MGSTKLTIRREQVNAKGLCTVYVYYGHKDDRCYFSTGEQVPLRSWDFKNSRAKSSLRGYTLMNALLLKKKGEIDDIKRKLIIEDVEPTVEEVKARRSDLLGPKKSKLTFFQIYDQFLHQKEHVERVSTGTMKQYRSFKERLIAFEKERKKKIALQNIDMKFHHDFLDYLELQLTLRANTAGNQVKHLKAFMQFAHDNDHIVKEDYKKFDKPRNEATVVALSESEFEQFRQYKFESKSLDRVRDAFIFSCVTGLRFSDYQNISKDNIVLETINGEDREFIKKYSQKTKEPILIPITSHSKKILEKYSYNLRVLSNQKTNEYLKKAAKEAGLTSPREILVYKARKKTIVTKPLCDIISTHSGRKSFATMSLNKNIPLHTIMAVTGHKSLSSFQKYVAYNKSTISDVMKEKWDDEDF